MPETRARASPAAEQDSVVSSGQLEPGALDARVFYA